MPSSRSPLPKAKRRTSPTDAGRQSSNAARARQEEPAAAKQTMKGEVLRQAILDTAAKLFIERGVGGTSIQDIAESLGLTRTAVYYYFKKKEDILQSLSEEVTISARQLAGKVAARQDLDPIAALRDLVRQHATHILSHAAGFRVVERNESDLTPKHRAAEQAARRGLLDNFRSVIERGIASGHFRMVDPFVTAFSLIGMCNWTAWWFIPGGRLSVEQISDAIGDLAVHAVQRAESRIPRKQDVRECLRLLHEDLAYLEKQLIGDL
jgi:AcrR family transcriptional regulator